MQGRTAEKSKINSHFELMAEDFPEPFIDGLLRRISWRDFLRLRQCCRAFSQRCQREEDQWQRVVSEFYGEFWAQCPARSHYERFQAASPPRVATQVVWDLLPSLYAFDRAHWDDDDRDIGNLEIMWRRDACDFVRVREFCEICCPDALWLLDRSFKNASLLPQYFTHYQDGTENENGSYTLEVADATSIFYRVDPQLLVVALSALAPLTIHYWELGKGECEMLPFYERLSPATKTVIANHSPIQIE